VPSGRSGGRKKPSRLPHSGRFFVKFVVSLTAYPVLKLLQIVAKTILCNLGEPSTGVTSLGDFWSFGQLFDIVGLFFFCPNTNCFSLPAGRGIKATSRSGTIRSANGTFHLQTSHGFLFKQCLLRVMSTISSAGAPSFWYSGSVRCQSMRKSLRQSYITTVDRVWAAAASGEYWHNLSAVC